MARWRILQALCLSLSKLLFGFDCHTNVISETTGSIFLDIIANFEEYQIIRTPAIQQQFACMVKAVL